MSGFRSITARIIWLHVLAIGAASVSMPVALYWLLRTTTLDLQHRALREHADAIADLTELRPDGHWHLNLPAPMRELYSQSYGRYAFAIIDDTGHVLFSSIGKGMKVFPDDPRAATESFFEQKGGDALIDGASIPETVAGHRLWVQVGQDLQHRDVLIDDIVDDFFQRIGWITLPILLLLLAVDILIFRQALRPILDASNMARAIGPTRIDLRLPTSRMPREILPLVNAVNQALDRLEQGFKVQREFTADAAHELRTPLAVLGMHVDTLVPQDAAKTLHENIAGMSRIVGQLLDIAELENFMLDPDDRADLHDVCAEVVAFLAPLALSSGKEIALVGESGPVWIHGNAEALFQAIRNLAENAVNHTPSGTVVEIGVNPTGTVRVTDKGPGIPPEERELIFRRFWRRDRRRAGSTGLGLSIVSRVVETHGGTISVENASGGGAAFIVNFRSPPLSGEEPVAT